MDYVNTAMMANTMTKLLGYVETAVVNVNTNEITKSADLSANLMKFLTLTQCLESLHERLQNYTLMILSSTLLLFAGLPTCMLTLRVPKYWR